MLVVQLLGEQRVTADGKTVEVGRSTRALGILSYLILHAGAPQLRRHMAGLFWPNSTDAQARTNLRREIHQLRAAIPGADGCLELDDNTVTWRDDAPCVADVLDFQHAVSAADEAAGRGNDSAFTTAAERAVRAYHGELLPGFYDDWVLEQRERLRRSCVTLVDRLIVSAEKQDDVATAMHHAQRRIELEPLEESGYRTLMRLHARLGNRAAALHTFHVCTSLLERELGVEPSDATLRMYEDLRPHQVKLTDAGSAFQQAAPLVGRHDALRVLHSQWGRAASGPRIVVVAGEAGVGKTRVAAEFADALERGGAVVAKARCFASRASLALAPVAEWLRASALWPAINGLDPVWRNEVGRLAPELLPGEAGPHAIPAAYPWQRGHFLEGLARAVLASQSPVLLVLDDVHWCDAQTLDWLELLLHLDPQAPLLVVATLRSEELDHNVAAAMFCRRLRAAGLLHDLELAPLTAEEVRELAVALGAGAQDERLGHRLHSQTGGFPLFVVESLRGGSTGWSRIDAILSGRLAQLTPPADELVGLAAAVGRNFSLELLGAAAGVDDNVVVAAVDQMWRRRLLREHSSNTYDFSHDLLRDAAYSQLTAPHKRLVHRRIAAAMERLYSDDLDRTAAWIADQYERGGQAGRAVDYHARAARAASAVFAHDDSVAHYERALALLVDIPPGAARDRLELDLRDGMLPSLIALKGYAARELGSSLERMVEVSRCLGDDGAVVRSQSALGAYLFVRGNIYQCAALTSEVADRVAGHPEHMGQVSLARTWALTSLGEIPRALEHFEHIEAQADVTELSPLGFPVRVMGTAFKAHALWLAGYAARAKSSAMVALDLAEAFDHPFSRTIAHAYAAITSQLLGDVAGAVQGAAEVRQLCARYDFAYYGEWGRILEGRAAGGAAGESLIREGLDRLNSARAGTRMPF